jgi:hypothetical protein
MAKVEKIAAVKPVGSVERERIPNSAVDEEECCSSCITGETPLPSGLEAV